MKQIIISCIHTIIFTSFIATISPSIAISDEPGIEQKSSFGFDVYKNRRAEFLDSLGEGTAILYSGGEETESGYRSGGNFWYLTGLDEEDAVLVLSPKGPDREVLFLEPRDIEAERWTGERPALTESLKVAWGFDRIYRTDYLDAFMVSNVSHFPTLHLISGLVGPSKDVTKDLEYYREVSERIPGISIKNSTRFLKIMRMRKSSKEIEAISKAIEVTHNGLSDLINSIQPGIMEFQLEGVLQESFKKQGAQHMAFPPIIGSGRETTILHYERLNRQIEAGQLLLLDIGAEWDHYSADITRTIPVDGVFNDKQAKIYNIVLKAEKAAIDIIKPGVTIREVDNAAKSVIREAGYIDDFIHSTSHFIGLDVHDAGDYWLPLEPGMVITVEPGIYLPDSEIGIRIEDDVLVTEKGHKVLSEKIPRERKDIEAWMAGK